MVATAPVATTTRRMRQLGANSLTNSAPPPASSARPRGPLKDAAVPTPSSLTAAPLPSHVETPAVVGAKRRMRWFFQSLSISRPAGSCTMQVGLFSRAPVPTPSRNPATPAPTQLRTSSVLKLSRRTAWPVSCTTYAASQPRPAPLSTVTPTGLVSAAAVPTPLAVPGAPVPTRVLTARYPGGRAARST
jgi:hypothetical protein